MSQENPDTLNVFDAAKKIVETLKGLDAPHQERAIRFASESLGLGPPQVQARAAMSPAPLTDPLSLPSNSSDRVTDIKQFTTEKAPKSDQQFAAVVAYFYQFVAPESQKKESIGAEDLTEAARLVRRRQPKKASFTLNNAKNAGYLDNAERGRFRLSTVGENLVAITLPGVDSPAVSSRASGKRKPKRRSIGKKPGAQPRK